MAEYENDYRHMLAVLNNQRPQRLPIYEHIISPEIMEQVLNVQFGGLIEGDDTDLDEFFMQYCRFFQVMTYDTVSFEVTITDQLPGHGAIMGGRPGPIQNRNDSSTWHISLRMIRRCLLTCTIKSVT
jgi:uroporphyrinogen decarboxylase